MLSSQTIMVDRHVAT